MDSEAAIRQLASDIELILECLGEDSLETHGYYSLKLKKEIVERLKTKIKTVKRLDLTFSHLD